MLDTDADVDLENPKRLFVALEDRKFDASQAPTGPDGSWLQTEVDLVSGSGAPSDLHIDLYPVECREAEPLTVSECWYGSPHRAEIMSPLCLCGAQLSTPTYLDLHAEKPAQSEEDYGRVWGKEREKKTGNETQREEEEEEDEENQAEK